MIYGNCLFNKVWWKFKLWIYMCVCGRIFGHWIERNFSLHGLNLGIIIRSSEWCVIIAWKIKIDGNDRLCIYVYGRMLENSLAKFWFEFDYNGNGWK